MSDDSSDGLFSRLKDAFRGVFYSGIPDHPAHGGNTGDTEWTPEDAKTAGEKAESERGRDEQGEA
ncbi:hypothetical protein [Halobacteriaceae bacterium SHR40]|uniref:hypothetical protein n=1 Tax=Halovenus amylolytica TaxID=2500550 RepID=UPI000FE3D7B0